MSRAIELPAVLRPWRQWLDGFDADIAAMLGELLLRLHPLLGSGGARVQAPAAETDGVGELSSRGSYARLLLTEWGMADIAPDEFLRRAASGEHLFLAPTPQRPQVEPGIVVVFDAGPAQWGDARLVHVALWILLLRRAQVQRARLRWGLAHAPGVLHDADAPERLLQLLHGRTQVVAGDAHWEAWQTALAVMPDQALERWQVTAPGMAVGSRGFTHRVRIRSGWDAQVHVALGAHQGGRAIVLPRPAAGPAARVLEGRFLTPADVPSMMWAKGRFSLRQPPVFSLSGTSVTVPLAGRNCAYQLRMGEAGQRKPAVARYHHWSNVTELVCALVTDKDVGGITVDAAHLHFWKIPGLRATPRPATDRFTVRPGTARWLQGFVLYAGRTRRCIAVLDHAGRLLTWTSGDRAVGGPAAGPALVADNVIAIGQAAPASLLYARVEGGYVAVSHLDSKGQQTEVVRLPVDSRPSAMWLSQTMDARSGTCCMEHRDPAGHSVLTLVHRDGRADAAHHRLALPAGWKPIGMMAPVQAHQPWRLLALRADQRALVALGMDGQETLHASSSDISAVSVSGCGGRIALVNLDGDLLVLGDHGRTRLACVRGRGETDDG
ncbi:hypothetical protein SOM22_09580 [Stenotrophomonas rhizophila]|uniref:hypothetical protein n=1 Tax=Stenotrophomonas rhizophila TaxID=216778 RepID=UPI002A6A25E6|nr:hypothetical protein [Stenotrophomonas rhizophila]MDY0954826.1 hypothetical protein [Stenotrophomonas rhizophila]